MIDQPHPPECPVTPNFNNCSCRPLGFCFCKTPPPPPSPPFSWMVMRGLGCERGLPRPPANTPKRVAQLCRNDISPDLAASHRYGHRSDPIRSGVAVAVALAATFCGSDRRGGASLNSICLLSVRRRTKSIDAPAGRHNYLLVLIKLLIKWKHNEMENQEG